ncbi:MAG: BrnA antitoxin family protein [Nitrospirae bacterium]|jgi:hypothetical protein|nr:BrnA antitoxin family protein [Nitrospirota bacterium]
MRKEYDLTNLKVKRRGPIKGFRGVPEAPEVKAGQIQVTMMLDKDVTQFYEEKAMSSEEGSFTEVINRILREHMHAH